MYSQFMIHGQKNIKLLRVLKFQLPETTFMKCPCLAVFPSPCILSELAETTFLCFSFYILIEYYVTYVPFGILRPQKEIPWIEKVTALKASPHLPTVNITICPSAFCQGA